MYLVSRQQSCIHPLWFLTHSICFSEFCLLETKELVVCSCIFGFNQAESVCLASWKSLSLSWLDPKGLFFRFLTYSSLHIKKCVRTEADFDHHCTFLLLCANLKHDLRFDDAHRFLCLFPAFIWQDRKRPQFPSPCPVWPGSHNSCWYLQFLRFEQSPISEPGQCEIKV